jgi:hypothetical protein
MSTKDKALSFIKYILTHFNIDSRGNKNTELFNASGKVDESDSIREYLNKLNVEGLSSTDAARHQIIVEINIPQQYIDTVALDQILLCNNSFMSACGFEYKSEDEPVLGSFFQKLIFWTRKPKTKQEIQEIYSKGKAALEANYLGKPVAESTALLSTAAAQLIAACQGVDEIVLRTGAIILVKVRIDNRTVMSVETISPLLMKYLDENPGSLKDPKLVYHFLENLPQAFKASSDSALTIGG